MRSTISRSTITSASQARFTLRNFPDCGLRMYPGQTFRPVSVVSIPAETGNEDAAKARRLSKAIAQSFGVSRREAERWIRAGEVTLSGKVVTSPQFCLPHNLPDGQLQARGKPVLLSRLVDAGEDDKDASFAQTPRLLVVHKVPGELVSDSDPHGRPCVMDRIPQHLLRSSDNHKKATTPRQHWKCIGRLDFMTEGLLLITNDGDFARQMELSRLHRVYKVRVHGRLKLPYLTQQFQYNYRNTDHGPMKIRPAPVIRSRGRKRQSAETTNNWLEVTCTEGRNRQVRKALERYGLQVTRLIRLGFGDYRLDDLPPGGIMEVPWKEVEEHKRQGYLFPSSPRRQKISKQQEQVLSSPIRWIR